MYLLIHQSLCKIGMIKTKMRLNISFTIFVNFNKHLPNLLIIIFIQLKRREDGLIYWSCIHSIWHICWWFVLCNNTKTRHNLNTLFYTPLHATCIAHAPTNENYKSYKI